ncbi:MAG: hypothetical protein Kow0065_10340 [Methylomicrobium sp.]
MRINLRVPYSQKEQAKMLGCKWDDYKKTWYVVNPSDLTQFLRWMPKIRSSGKKKPAWQKILERMD